MKDDAEQLSDMLPSVAAWKSKSWTREVVMMKKLRIDFTSNVELQAWRDAIQADLWMFFLRQSELRQAEAVIVYEHGQPRTMDNLGTAVDLIDREIRRLMDEIECTDLNELAERLFHRARYTGDQDCDAAEMLRAMLEAMRIGLKSLDASNGQKLLDE